MSISHNTLRLLECFKSITLIFSDKEDNADIITFDDIANWIKSYNKWYTNVSKMEEGKHLHLAYGREVEITEKKSFLINNEQLEKIHSASYECGFLLKLNIALCDLVVDSSAFLTFLSEQRGIAINIHASQNIAKENALPILETIASKNVLLSFIGSYSFWNQLGILSSPIINRYLYRIISISNSREKHLLDTFNPCARRFHIVVDENGWIYPCRGLIGITQCCLGTIYDDIFKIKILDNKYPINLSSLEMKGPELTERSATPAKGLPIIQQIPLVCSIHRSQIQ